ncbi:N-acetyllactosaminide beta-1,3-N-acetylglucosaminyltransferase 2 [Acanthochromis polyacanthus]|uniref:N-acetyllactosaminide beta-1,3-N-acetylglucosaminyltransferase 2 n=1 Tax=Acanthochromis polyacanthus TaxID=80966 RepID=UPI002234D66E|nr:N-acetyllactosaminide beta-1,3-N-acetylglucosaminyltransferase 2 [Acanthochromis polyacanthus]
MRRIKTISAVILLVSLILVFFYSSLHLESAYGHQAGLEDVLRQHSLEVHDSDVKIQPPTQEASTTPQPKLNATISNNLRKAIPQNGAYWNRLLYSALRSVENAENHIRGNSSWSGCRETSQELLQTNIQDFTTYPVLFQTFLQGMKCKSPPVLIDQPSCNNTFLLLAIKSTPEHFEQRQAVRETWGREGMYPGGLRVRLVFLLGSSPPEDPDFTPLVALEAKHYGDMLQWDFRESLFNLTLKMNVLLQWAPKSCHHASFIFSGDDDVFVNTPALLRYLQSLGASKASRLYVGHVISSASPHRDPKNKYFIPLSFYDGPYPAYAGGGGFVFSGDLLQPLHSVLRLVPFFPIDDVYIAMCFKALGVSPEAHAGFKTFDVKEQDRENLCVHKDHLLIHRRSPQQMKKLWKGIHSPFLTC